MLVTTLDAKAKLEAEGLHVTCNDANSLWIAANMRETGNGINLSEDACSLIWDSGRWVAVFPAEGMLTYEVPGSLSELVALITAVYTQCRRAGGHANDALRRVVTDPDQYLLSRSPAHV